MKLVVDLTEQDRVDLNRALTLLNRTAQVPFCPLAAAARTAAMALVDFQKQAENQGEPENPPF